MKKVQIKETVREYFIPVLLIVLLSINLLYWCSQKEGYHIDELYAYSQVCDTEHVRTKYDQDGVPFLGNWHDVSYFEDFLTITEEEAFDLKGAWNTANVNHAHPPLYFVAFEFFTSLFFQNNFTKWSGLLFNFIFYILNLFFLYLMSRKLLNDRVFPLSVTLIYGISVGAVSSVVYIRMYMLMTFLTTLLIYMHYKLYKKVNTAKDNTDAGKGVKLWPEYIGIAACIFIGILVHYYYIVFAFFLCLFFGIGIIAKKYYKNGIQYALVTFGSAIFSCIICPSFLFDMFEGRRGEEAIQNALTPRAWYEQTVSFLNVVNDSLFGGLGLYFLLCVVIGVLCILFIRNKRFFHLNKQNNLNGPVSIVGQKDNPDGEPVNKKRDSLLNNDNYFILIVLFAVACYFVTLSLVAPHENMRYIMNTFPIIILLVCYSLYSVFSKIGYKKIPGYIVLSVLLLLNLYGYHSAGVSFLFKGFDQQIEQMKNYQGDRMLVVSNADDYGNWVLPYLLSSSMVYPTSIKDVTGIEDALKGFNDEEIVVFLGSRFATSEEKKEAIKRIEEMLKPKEFEKVFRTVGFCPADVFVLSF